MISNHQKGGNALKSSNSKLTRGHLYKGKFQATKTMSAKVLPMTPSHGKTRLQFWGKTFCNFGEKCLAKTSQRGAEGEDKGAGSQELGAEGEAAGDGAGG